MRFLVPCLIALALAPAASADRPLIVGVTEDGLKYEPAPTAKDARALGIDAVRITLTWRPGLTEPDAGMREQLDHATSTTGLRVVLSVFGEKAAYAPQTEQARDEYCGFLGSIVKRYRSIRDVVVWNEPNKE